MRTRGGYVTWREFEQQTDLYRQLVRRVDAMDTQGTRGVGTLQVTVAQLAATVSELRSDVREWRATHEKEHETEESQRVSGRRWLIGATIAALAASAAVVSMLATLLIHGPA